MGNYGIAGDTSGGILSRLGLVLSLTNPDFVVFDVFLHNDVTGPGYTLATTMANIDSITKVCRAAKAEPVFVTAINANDTGSNESPIVNQNRALSAYCVANDVICIDAQTAICDPANKGQLLSTYDSGDHLHPNESGHLALASSYWSAFQNFLPYGTFLLPSSDSDPWNLLPHGTFASMGGQSTAPTGWSNTGAGTGTFSYATNSAVKGQALTITRLAANGTSGGKGITVSVAQGAGTFSVGDTVAFVGRLVSATVATQGASFDASVGMTGASSSPAVIYPYKSMGVDISSGSSTAPQAWYQQGVVATGTTALSCTLVLNNGANTTADASVVLGQVGLYNLTKLGVAY
jgi:hypothetical protein